MKIKKTILFTLTSAFLFTGCGGLSDAKKAITNQKNSNSDEFFIEKKGPLTLPPDYEVIPEPESMNTKNIKKKENIEDILNISKKEKKISSKSKSTEQSIINQINK